MSVVVAYRPHYCSRRRQQNISRKNPRLAPYICERPAEQSGQYNALHSTPFSFGLGGALSGKGANSTDQRYSGCFENNQMAPADLLNRMPFRAQSVPLMSLRLITVPPGLILEKPPALKPGAGFSVPTEALAWARSRFLKND